MINKLIYFKLNIFFLLVVMKNIIIIIKKTKDGNLKCSKKIIKKNIEKKVQWKSKIVEYCPNSDFIRNLDPIEKVYFRLYRSDMWDF